MKENLLVRSLLGSSLNEIQKKVKLLKFATLENTFYVKNSQFEIPKMLIKSNVLDLTISGWQHFDERLSYSFEFDLRDLKKHGTNKQSEFGDIVDDGNSIRLFLKMFGTLSDISMSWDGEARKAYKKEQREQEKQDIKSMLKSEFGLFKKDTTVQNYERESKQKERIEIDFGDDEPKNVEEKKKEINDKFQKIRKKNQTKPKQIELEFE